MFRAPALAGSLSISRERPPAELTSGAASSAAGVLPDSVHLCYAQSCKDRNGRPSPDRVRSGTRPTNHGVVGSNTAGRARPFQGLNHAAVCSARAGSRSPALRERQQRDPLEEARVGDVRRRLATIVSRPR